MRVPLIRVIRHTGAWLARVAMIFLSVVGIILGLTEADAGLMYLGTVGLFVLIADIVFASYSTIKRLGLALAMPAGSTYAALDFQEERQRLHGRWFSRKLILLVIFCCCSFWACGKKDLVRLNSDAITLLAAALRTSDAAYQSGFLSAETEREILMSGEQTRKVLLEVNAFASFLPDGQLPAAEQKTKVLTALDAAISHMNSLVAQGALFTEVKSQKTYYRYIRPAQTVVMILRATILKIEVSQHPVPHTLPSFDQSPTWQSRRLYCSCLAIIPPQEA